MLRAERLFSQEDFVKALNLMESFLVRRSVLQLQTRNYWSVFARMAHAIDEEQPFTSFQVALARQNYKFPTDQDFMMALQERDLYDLRICWHILSQLENAGYAEPSPTTEYSIEHIMPQWIDGVPGMATYARRRVRGCSPDLAEQTRKLDSHRV